MSGPEFGSKLSGRTGNFGQIVVADHIMLAVQSGPKTGTGGPAQGPEALLSNPKKLSTLVSPLHRAAATASMSRLPEEVVRAFRCARRVQVPRASCLLLTSSGRHMAREGIASEPSGRASGTAQLMNN